jgi:hypothetical protein
VNKIDEIDRKIKDLIHRLMSENEPESTASIVDRLAELQRRRVKLTEPAIFKYLDIRSHA